MSLSFLFVSVPWIKSLFLVFFFGRWKIIEAVVEKTELYNRPSSLISITTSAIHNSILIICVFLNTPSLPRSEIVPTIYLLSHIFFFYVPDPPARIEESYLASSRFIY